MRVEPQDLREAATKIDGGWKPPRNPDDAFTSAARGLRPTDTANALTEVGGAVASALSTLASRRDEIVRALDTSADRYQNTDMFAARRIAAVGGRGTEPHTKE